MDATGAIVPADLEQLQEVFWALVERDVRRLVVALIEWTLGEVQRQQVGADWHERSAHRRAHRNGYYERQLVSPYGPLCLRVPRLRDGGVVCGMVFQRYRRRHQDVDRVLQRSYLLGVSQRDAASLGEQLFGGSVSHQTISRLGRWLDEELARYRRQPIEAVYPVVQADGMYVTVAGCKRVVMLVLGLREDGRKEVLGFSLGTGEGCRGLLWDLRRRGLEGVALFVTDDSGALQSALEEVYPEVPRQVCTWHRLVGLWTLLGPVPWRWRMVREARRIFRCVSLPAAREEAERWARRWATRSGPAVRWLRERLEDSLVFYHMPEPWWRRTRTTSLAERLIRKLRRRLRPMGAFTNPPAAERAVFGQLLRWHLVPEFTHKG